MPGYSSNAVLQLVIACGVGFVAFFFTVVCFQAFAHMRYEDAYEKVVQFIALPQAKDYGSRWWTLLTYGWSHPGFWIWFSNMIWLYCFGAVVQSLVGHRQIIPLFFTGALVGGIAYLLVQLVPGVTAPAYLLGAQAGITALAAASLTIAPDYRLYLGDRLAIPQVVIVIVFALLQVLTTNLNVSLLLVLAGGALGGFLYIKALQGRYNPGEWVYNTLAKMNQAFTPDEEKARLRLNKKRNQVLSRMYEPKEGITQKRIDELLDKIIQHGYHSLTKEEKETLFNAGKGSDQ
jgi:membrane associated rhomboid family serine protease